MGRVECAEVSACLHFGLCHKQPHRHCRYEGKLTGDTPEFMPLDSNLFSDLETAITWNVAGTRSLSRGHPDRFCLATPDDCWSAVERTWMHAPTSARIVEDIERVFVSIDVVVEHKGVAVDFKALRHGRRLADHEASTGRVKKRIKNDSDFDFLGSLHPAAVRNIDNIIDLTL